MLYFPFLSSYLLNRYTLPSASDDTYTQVVFAPALGFVMGCCWALLSMADVVNLQGSGKMQQHKVFKSRFQKDVKDG